MQFYIDLCKKYVFGGCNEKASAMLNHMALEHCKL